MYHEYYLYIEFSFVDMPKNNTTMDSRLEYRFGGGVGGSMHSPSSHSPTKESLKNSERLVVNELQYFI